MKREVTSKLTSILSFSTLRLAITSTKWLEFFTCESVLPAKGDMREAMCPVVRIGGCVQYPSHFGVVVIPHHHHCSILYVSRQNHLILQAPQLLQGLPLFFGQVVFGWLGMPQDATHQEQERLALEWSCKSTCMCFHGSVGHAQG